VALLIASDTHNLLNGVVCAQGVVMSECQPSHFRLSAHGNSIFDGAVSPSSLACVFIEGELRVMDDKVSHGEKVAMPAILAVYLPLARCQMTRERLMIGRIN
jgi:hypothetical protein